MELEVDYSELPSNLISNLFNMHLEIEKIEKELSDLFGFLELMLDQELGVSYSSINEWLKKNILLR